MNCSEIAEIAPLYRSGELDPARAAAFSRHIAACSECASEMHRQVHLDDLLCSGIVADHVDSAAVDRRVRERIGVEFEVVPGVLHAPARPRWRIAAIASVAASLLLVIGYRDLSRAHSVYADAVADHRSEIVNDHWRLWRTDPAGIASLAGANGVAPDLILALAPPGYHLARAKRCALDGRPFLHLVYSNRAQEFSAYLRPRDSHTLAGFSASGSRAPSGGLPYTIDFGAEHLGCVETPGMTLMIVTDESADAASRLARSAAATLASSTAHF